MKQIPQIVKQYVSETHGRMPETNDEFEMSTKAYLLADQMIKQREL